MTLHTRTGNPGFDGGIPVDTTSRGAAWEVALVWYHARTASPTPGADRQHQFRHPPSPLHPASGVRRVEGSGQHHHHRGSPEFADAGITVSLVVPSITATEFVGGRFRDTAHLPPGLTVHSPQYVGRVTLRALDTGAARIDVPPGPGQPDFHEPTVR